MGENLQPKNYTAVWFGYPGVPEAVVDRMFLGLVIDKQYSNIKSKLGYKGVSAVLLEIPFISSNGISGQTLRPMMGNAIKLYFLDRKIIPLKRYANLNDPHIVIRPYKEECYQKVYEDKHEYTKGSHPLYEMREFRQNKFPFLDWIGKVKNKC